jgi:hypothetical protein
METRLTVRARFGAATRRSAGEDVRERGHSYEVEAEAVGADYTLGRDLLVLAQTLDGKRLEDMLTGASSDLVDLPAWFAEQLVMEHRGLVRVSVTQWPENLTATALRELRAPVRA